MSYGVSAALQTAVYQRLVSDEALALLVGAAIFDTVPGGPLPGLYLALGSEEVRDASSYEAAGAIHDFQISVVSETASFLAAKEAAAAVSDALCNAPLTLARGRLVSLAFVRAKARQSQGGSGRRIDLSFRARVEDEA